MNCNCGEAKLVTVKKEGPNTGRKFYACAKPQGSQCDFFLWEGETPRATQKRAGGDREALTGQVLASMNSKLDKILATLDAMQGHIETRPATKEELKNLPF